MVTVLWAYAALSVRMMCMKCSSLKAVDMCCKEPCGVDCGPGLKCVITNSLVAGVSGVHWSTAGLYTEMPSGPLQVTSTQLLWCNVSIVCIQKRVSSCITVAVAETLWCNARFACPLSLNTNWVTDPYIGYHQQLLLFPQSDHIALAPLWTYIH